MTLDNVGDISRKDDAGDLDSALVRQAFNLAGDGSGSSQAKADSKQTQLPPELDNKCIANMPPEYRICVPRFRPPDVGIEPGKALLPRDREITGGLPVGIEGKFTTTTGDTIEIKDGKQTLTTAAGDRLEVDKQGNISGEGVTKVHASPDGKERIVTFKDGTSVRVDQTGIARVEHALPAQKPGSYMLTTGDTIENIDGSQRLSTPGGTQLTVNKDGSYEAEGKVVSASADGKTIKLGDGSIVHLENGRVAGVERDGQTARLCGTIPRQDWDPSFRELIRPIAPIYGCTVDVEPIIKRHMENTDR